MKDGKRMRKKKKRKDYLDPHCVLVGLGGRQGLVRGLSGLHSKPQTLVMVTEVGLRVEVGYPL